MDLKKIILGIVLIVVLANFVGAVCCEKTDAGVFCQDVIDEDNCNEEFEIEPSTSCESTDYCSTGTCINIIGGTCIESPKTTCDTTLGGLWYTEGSPEINQHCQVGCCILGESAYLSEKVACDAQATASARDSDFRENIVTQDACSAMANLEEKGACVYDNSDCDVLTREECKDNLGITSAEELNDRFHAGLLCTAPGLSICVPTSNTRCVDGEVEVYFEDSCENAANVYDSSKTTDTDYWNRIIEPEDSCGAETSNVLSETCGNCDYGGGSTCGETSFGESVDEGDYICKDLNCEYNGETYQHASSWCSEPIENFENAVPGQLSYRLSCYDGVVDHKVCGYRRERLCVDANLTAETSEISKPRATCEPNRWDICYWINNSEDCLDTTKVDCKVIDIPRRELKDVEDWIVYENVDFIDSATSDFIGSSCAPKYRPAIKFWEDDAVVTSSEEDTEWTSSSLCAMGSEVGAAVYVKRIPIGWEGYSHACYEKCKEWSIDPAFTMDVCLATQCSGFKRPEALRDWVGKIGLGRMNLEGDLPLKEAWAQEKQDYCVAISDCGIKSNYEGHAGGNAWKNLFIGNYTLDSLPNANDVQ